MGGRTSAEKDAQDRVLGNELGLFPGEKQEGLEPERARLKVLSGRGGTWGRGMVGGGRGDDGGKGRGWWREEVRGEGFKTGQQTMQGFKG